MPCHNSCRPIYDEVKIIKCYGKFCPMQCISMYACTFSRLRFWLLKFSLHHVRLFLLQVLELSKQDLRRGQALRNATIEATFRSLWSTTQKATRLLGKWKSKDSITIITFPFSSKDYPRSPILANSSPDKESTICWSMVETKFFLSSHSL